MTPKYIQEYAGKVGEKRKSWRSQLVPNRTEYRGLWVWGLKETQRTMPKPENRLDQTQEDIEWQTYTVNAPPS